MSHNFGSTSAIDQRMISQVKSKILATKIFVISKITCRACQQAKALLNMVVSGTGITPSFFNIDHYPQEKRKLLMKYITAETGITTVPQVFINGRFVGGNDDIQQLHQMGRLVPLIGTRTRKRITTKVLSINNVVRSVRVPPIKADVLPVTISDTSFVNSNSLLHNGDRRSRRSSSWLRSSPNTKNEYNNWDLTRKLTVSQSNLQPRESFFSYTGSVQANTNARRSGNNRLLSSIQRSTPVSHAESGKNLQINFYSDEAILRKSSVILRGTESGRFRKGGPDYFTTVSGWI